MRASEKSDESQIRKIVDVSNTDQAIRIFNVFFSQRFESLYTDATVPFMTSMQCLLLVQLRTLQNWYFFPNWICLSRLVWLSVFRIRV